MVEVKQQYGVQEREKVLEKGGGLQSKRVRESKRERAYARYEGINESYRQVEARVLAGASAGHRVNV